MAFLFIGAGSVSKPASKARSLGPRVSPDLGFFLCDQRKQTVQSPLGDVFFEVRIDGIYERYLVVGGRERIPVTGNTDLFNRALNDRFEFGVKCTGGFCLR